MRIPNERPQLNIYYEQYASRNRTLSNKVYAVTPHKQSKNNTNENSSNQKTPSSFMTHFTILSCIYHWNQAIKHNFWKTLKLHNDFKS